MDLIPYSPFESMDDFFEQWMGSPFIGEPKMDVYETKGKFVAEAEMPGVDPETIKVAVENNFLRIEAKKEEKKEEKEKGYYRKEIKSGEFKRMVLLPDEVEGGKAKAKYESGVLKIEIPKSKKVKTKEKSIKVDIKK